NALRLFQKIATIDEVVKFDRFADDFVRFRKRSFGFATLGRFRHRFFEGFLFGSVLLCGGTLAFDRGSVPIMSRRQVIDDLLENFAWFAFGNSDSLEITDVAQAPYQLHQSQPAFKG